MPSIKIKESSLEKGNVSFDATDSVVLIPLVVKENLDSEFELFDSTNTYTALKEKLTIKDNINHDPSYEFGLCLLQLGLKVLVRYLVKSEMGADTFETLVNKAIKSGLEEGGKGCYESIKSKNMYNVKFVTSGAHANYISSTGCSDELVNVASTRGDAVALVEAGQDSTFETLKSISITNGEYACMTWPGGSVTISNTKFDWMPGAFIYLTAFANSIKSNPDWFATAGYRRGVSPVLLKCKHEVTEAMANDMQDNMLVSINPVMSFNQNGTYIYGNRTMIKPEIPSGGTERVLKFKNFLNVRVLLCDIKKQIYEAASRSTFEPNDDITFVTFKQMVNKKLDEMRNNRGLDYYYWSDKIVDDNQKGVLKANLTVKPIEAVEDFVIGVVLTDSDATASEEI